MRAQIHSMRFFSSIFTFFVGAIFAVAILLVWAAPGIRLSVRTAGTDTIYLLQNAYAQGTQRQPEGSPSPGEVWKEPVTGMAFVWVPGGCFNMGSPSDEIGRDPDEGPLHEVCVGGFWMGQTEVTNAQCRKFKPGYDSRNYHGYSLNGDDQPAVFVNWYEAKAFAKWLTEKANGKYRFRLPTEAEWEYACRGGTTSSRFWGEDPDQACRYANVADLTAARRWTHWRVNQCEDGYEVTAPVGSFDPNPFGLYDMLGNLFEWCEDVYSEDAYRLHGRKNPAITAGGSDRVIRGGCWYSWPAGVRCAGRSDHPAAGRGARDYFIGFRLVRTP